MGKEDITGLSSRPLNVSRALEMQGRQCWWLLAFEKVPQELKRGSRRVLWHLAQTLLTEHGRKCSESISFPSARQLLSALFCDKGCYFFYLIRTLNLEKMKKCIT